MIINFSYKGLIVLISFVFLFPIIQKQWFNLYLFNINNFSLYYILYYISGIVCPLIVIANSLKNLTYYNFKKVKLDVNKVIKGKILLILILVTLTPLSLLIINYFYINLDLIFKVFLKKDFHLHINNLQNFYLFLFIFILLIFNKTRYFIKKFILLNYLFVTFIIWNMHVNNISVSHKLRINGYLNIENSNVINITFLLLIEIIYYFWSFISYKNNLSDWAVPFPLKKNLYSFIKIIVSYLFIIIYYLILDR